MFGLGPEASGVIIGAILGSAIGLISGVIIEKLSYKHRKEENRVKYLRELSLKKIEAYRFTIHQLMIINDALVKTVEIPENNLFIFLTPIFSQAITAIFPNIFLFPENLENKIISVLFETLAKVANVPDKDSFTLITNELSKEIKSIIGEMKQDLKNLEKI